MRELEIELPDGRSVHVRDAAPEQVSADAPVVFWHHGTPQSGQLPGPLLPIMNRLGARLVSHDRPGYGASSPQPGRDVASVAHDTAAIADALEIGRFAVLGASGGGPHALACAALLGDRVPAVGCLASVAPFGAPDLDWFAGMAPSGVAEFTAANQSREALLGHLTRDEPEDFSEFAAADLPIFAGPYGQWLVSSSTEAVAAGFEGALEDDRAFVSDWGFDPASIEVPVLLAHGGADRFVPSAHARWLAARIPKAELRLTKQDGHISVFTRMESTVRWVLHHWSADTRGA